MSGISFEKIADLFKRFVVSETNEGAWFRLLALFVLCSAAGIALSVWLFLGVRGVGSREIESSVTVPETREVDKTHIREVLGAFDDRVELFAERRANGISVPDPY